MTVQETDHARISQVTLDDPQHMIANRKIRGARIRVRWERPLAHFFDGSVEFNRRRGFLVKRAAKCVNASTGKSQASSPD
jgi:hypothetical protein